ncbi:MAG: hypothetical protein ACREOZ_01700 [Gloeomargaritales cyanobacterium]
MSGNDMITRSRGEEIFTNLFKFVYKIHPALSNLTTGVDHSSNPLWLCMEQMEYDNILDILELSDVDIDALTYENGSDRICPLPLKYRKTLKFTVWWRNISAAKSQDNVSVDWDLLTEESFARFRQEVVPLLQANAKVKEITHSMSSSMNINEIDKFNSSIRRDATAFPTFSGKNDDWFAYDRDLLAMARVQQVDRILEITAMIPTEGSRDIAFWNVQNVFLYSVFSSKMTKGQAAIFVREESNTCDAHAVYKKMSHNYNADSNRLAIQVRYETKISKLIWDYNYSGGPNKFLGDFQQCILDLEAAKKYPLPDCEKKSKLCLAIKDPQFLSVRDIIASNTNVNYAESITMLENHIMMIAP